MSYILLIDKRFSLVTGVFGIAAPYISNHIFLSNLGCANLALSLNLKIFRSKALLQALLRQLNGRSQKCCRLETLIVLSVAASNDLLILDHSVWLGSHDHITGRVEVETIGYGISGQDNLRSGRWIVLKFVEHPEVLCMLVLIIKVEDESIIQLALDTSALLNALKEDEYGRSCFYLLIHQLNNLCEEFFSSEAALFLDPDDIQLDFTCRLHLVRGVKNIKSIIELTLKPLIANTASKSCAQGECMLNLA